MSARCPIIPLILCAVVAAAGGCSSSPSWFDARDKAESPPQGRMPHADVVEFNEGVADASAGRFDDAARKFADVLSKFQATGDHAHASETMFLLGMCYEKTARKEQAAIFYQKVMSQYPRTKPAAMAAERLSRLDLKKTPSE